MAPPRAHWAPLTSRPPKEPSYDHPIAAARARERGELPGPARHLCEQEPELSNLALAVASSLGRPARLSYDGRFWGLHSPIIIMQLLQSQLRHHDSDATGTATEGPQRPGLRVRAGVAAAGWVDFASGDRVRIGPGPRRPWEPLGSPLQVTASAVECPLRHTSLSDSEWPRGPPAGRRSLTRSLLPACASGSLSPSATATGASGMMQFEWRQPAGEVPACAGAGVAV